MKKYTNDYTKGEWVAIEIEHNCFAIKEKTLPNGFSDRIAELYQYNAEANAYRIIKCVNAHEELANALKKLLNEYEYALNLLAEASGMTYSENNFVISNKKLLNSIK